MCRCAPAPPPTSRYSESLLLCCSAASVNNWPFCQCGACDNQNSLLTLEQMFCTIRTQIRLCLEMRIACRAMGYRRRTLEMQADRIEAVLQRHRAGPCRRRAGHAALRALPAGIGWDDAREQDHRPRRRDRHGTGQARGTSTATAPPSRSKCCAARPRPVRMFPLCDRLSLIPPVTAVLGLEQDGTPLLYACPRPT